MTQADDHSEDRFAALLAEIEAQLAAGAAADKARLAKMPDVRLAGRLAKAGQCLELLKQVWPFGSDATDGEPPADA